MKSLIGLCLISVFSIGMASAHQAQEKKESKSFLERRYEKFRKNQADKLEASDALSQDTQKEESKKSVEDFETKNDRKLIQ